MVDGGGRRKEAGGRQREEREERGWKRDERRRGWGEVRKMKIDGRKAEGKEGGRIGKRAKE